MSKKVLFYKTLEETIKAAQTLGIKKYSEYRLRYNEDPQLPSNPRTTYISEWISWSHFFSKCM